MSLTRNLIPADILTSAILSLDDVEKLGSIRALPTSEELANYKASGVLNELFDEARYGCQYLPDLLHLRAKQLLSEKNVKEAWLTLLQV